MVRTLKRWKDFCHKRGTSGDMIFDILEDWQSEESGRPIDDLSQELSGRERELSELNQFLGLIALELGEEKWNKLVSKFDQWKLEQQELVNGFDQWFKGRKI